MRCLARCLTVAVIVSATIKGSHAQLLANVKNFVSNIPTFNSNNDPSFAVQDGRVNVNVPVPQNLQFGTVDPKTGTWELTDKSLGAGVALGPHGAQLLTATPSTGNTQFQQAAALGPNGLTIGPNKVDAPSSEQQRQAEGNLGIQNLKIGKDGLIINDGSRLNSSVLVDPQGIQLNGNPTGGGDSHLYIKPNFNVLGHQFGQAAPPQESKNNVQLSYGDGKTTATQQLNGYTNYQLDPSKGTYARVPNQAPPFMGVNPSAAGKYTSFAQAPAAGQSSANAQQGTMQNGAAPSGYAAQAPMKQYQVVQTPNPRRFDYASDLASGSPQAAAAYAKQLGGNVQQAQQQMDQRQEVFNKLQNQLNAENAARDQAARVPIAVPVPPPAYQDGSFKRLPGMSDAGSLAVAADLANSGVTSFAQQSFAPDQAPQLHREMGPAVAIQPEGFAPGPAEEGDLDLRSFLKKDGRKKKKKAHTPAPAPGHEHHHKKNETTPEHKGKKAEAKTPAEAAAIGHAHALDSETPATPGGLTPAQVTAAAKNEAVASGSGKAVSTLPTPQNGGATPTPTPTPLPYSPANPANPAAYVHSLLSDKSAEVVGENFLAISPTAGVPEPDFVEMTPAQASAPAADFLASPMQAPAPAPIKAPAAAPELAAHAPAPAHAHAPRAAAKHAGAQFQAHAPKHAAAMLAFAPGLSKQDRFLEALAFVNEQNAAGAIKDHEGRARAPAPAALHARAGTASAGETLGRKMLGA